jgi:hypothetical protein
MGGQVGRVDFNVFANYTMKFEKNYKFKIKVNFRAFRRAP